jgi:predicted Fe-S protein YdhL (DUF1289 family)
MSERPPLPSPPGSPCILVCRMDAADRYCLGCARTRDEIARWWAMPDAEKRSVLATLATRRGDRRPG